MKSNLLFKTLELQGSQPISDKNTLVQPLVFLDTMRTLSALMVLLVHLLQVFAFRFLGPQHIASHLFGTFARHAVIIFFLLSGYLVCRSMLTNATRFGRFNMLDYAAARLARIYPPFLVAFALSVLVWLVISLFVLPGSPPNPFAQPGYGVAMPLVITLTVHEILSALMLFSGLDATNPPLWSLYVEVRLYLLAGLLAWSLSRRAFLVAIAPLALLVWFSYSSPEFLVFCVLWSVAATFALIEWRLGRIPQHWLVVAILAGVILLVLLITLNGSLALSQLDPIALHRYCAQLGFGLIYAGLLLYCRRANTGIVLTRLADWSCWSYSLYVTHVPVIYLMASISQPYIGMSPWAATLAGGLTCLAAVWVARRSSKLAEHPAVFKIHLLRGASILHSLVAGQIAKQTDN